MMEIKAQQFFTSSGRQVPTDKPTEYQAALESFNELLKDSPDFYETGDLEKIMIFEKSLDTLVPPTQESE